MTELKSKPIVFFLIAVVFVAGFAFLAYGRFAASLTIVGDSIRDQQFEKALSLAEAAEARFEKLPWLRQVFTSRYSHLIENHLWLLYALERYDDLIEKSAALADQPAVHFWTGCAFIQKANLEEKKESALVWLSRSEDELRQALESNSADWDTKYNFELAKRLIEDIQKPRKKNETRIMKLLRPQPKTGPPSIRKTGFLDFFRAIHA